MKKCKPLFYPNLFNIFFVAITFSLLALPGQSLANEFQARICKSAMGLGQAEARTVLFGIEMNGLIPNDQLIDIQTNLTNAAAELTAAESLMLAPLPISNSISGTFTNVRNGIASYPERATKMSFTHRGTYIANLFGILRKGLAITYESSRLDALQANPNCDSAIARACYNWGKATIASTIASDFGNRYQANSNAAFKAAIRDGLDVGMDRSVTVGDPGHTPWNGHARKICCTAGTPTAWEAMGFDSINQSTLLATYGGRTSTLLGIIGAAEALDPVCGSDRNNSRCASSGSRPRGSGRCVYLGNKDWVQLGNHRAPLLSVAEGLLLEGAPWTNGKLRNGVVDGNGIQSTATYDMSRGGEIYMQFSVNGAGTYMALINWTATGIRAPNLTTHHSYASSVVIPEHQWLYAKAVVLPNLGYTLSLSTSGYDGNSLFRHSGTLSASNVRLKLDFVDNGGGAQTNVLLTEAKVCSTSTTTTTAQVPVPVPAPVPTPPSPPKSCADAGMTITNKVINPPPYGGTNPVCKDGTGKLWFHSAWGMEEVTSINRGQPASNGCYPYSNIITKERSFKGTLCPP